MKKVLGLAMLLIIILGGTYSCADYTLDADISEESTNIQASLTYITPPASGDPFGNLESITGIGGEIKIKGWAIDPDTTDAVYMWVVIDGVGKHYLANKTRSDVGDVYPEFGDNHGFEIVIPASTGTHQVSVTANNVYAGSHKTFGSQTVSVYAGSPLGNVDSIYGVAGEIIIKGWAIDPDTTDSVYMWVVVDGVGKHYLANKTRTDVGSTYPDYGPTHGFEIAIPASAGNHQVSVTANNVFEGSHKTLVSKTVAVYQGSPFGNFESLTKVTGGIRIKGWAIDPDTTGTAYIWVTVDGVGRLYQANSTRTDVGTAYPGYGNNHGFDQFISIGDGYHTVSVTINNVQVGSHKDLGTKNVGSVPDSGWTRPMAGYYVSQEFKGASVHNGIDLAKAYGSGIYAARSGKIKAILLGHLSDGSRNTYTLSGWVLDPVYYMSGDKVVIEHADGMLSIYDHCEAASGIFVGKTVYIDELIGYVNQSGNRTGPHLHFAIFTSSSYYSPVNPRNYIGF